MLHRPINRWENSYCWNYSIGQATSIVRAAIKATIIKQQNNYQLGQRKNTYPYQGSLMLCLVAPLSHSQQQSDWTVKSFSVDGLIAKHRWWRMRKKQKHPLSVTGFHRGAIGMSECFTALQRQEGVGVQLAL